MDEQQPVKTTAKTYPKRLSAYDNEEGERMLRGLARKLGISEAGVIRMAIRELAKREGVE